MLLGLLCTLVADEDPLRILGVLYESAFGTWYDAGTTLFYATPLIFTGLSVSVAFRAGLFNIGAEGQLLMGALAATAVGINVGFENSFFSSLLAVSLATCAAFAAGALWAYIPALLWAKRGSHEVISTIMLNFVAAGITQWFVLNIWPNPETQNPETTLVAEAFRLSKVAQFSESALSSSFFFAIILATFVYLIFNCSLFGFKQSATGQNPKAAQIAGIDTIRVKVVSLTLAGGIAGLVALPEILGNSHRFKLGFSPGYGFTGIAVALLAQANPVAVIFSALLFGALHKGTADLDFQTEHITRDFSLIIQALIMLSLASAEGWRRLFKLRLPRKETDD